MSLNFTQMRGEGWFRLGPVEMTSTVIVLSLSVVSLFLYAADPSLLSPFVFSATGVTSGQVWRLVTWPLVAVPDFTALITFLLFYLFGRDIERILGRRRFLWFLLPLTLVPPLVVTLLSFVAGQDPVAGLRLLAIAIIVAYIAINPTARTFFDLPFWVLYAVLLGIYALSFIGNREWTALEFGALEVGLGLLLARSFHLSRLSWIPSIPLPSFMTGEGPGRTVAKKDKLEKRAAHLKVIRTDDINRILEKINDHGMDSLTREERRQLDDFSRDSRA
jgi:membrane associated rhomboid family serine protease